MRLRELPLLAASLAAVLSLTGSALAAPKNSPPAATSASVSKAAPQSTASRDASAKTVEREALADINSADYGQARRRLERELGRCGTNACSPAMRARLFAILGVVQSGGLRKPADAASSFDQALSADPQVSLPEGATPEARKAFDEARARVAPRVAAPAARTAEPVAPVAMPAPAEVPIKPLQKLADARWTEIGFVRPADSAWTPTEAAPAPDRAQAVGEPLKLQRPSSMRLDDGLAYFRTGVANFAPVNDGTTDPAGTLDSAFWLGFAIRPEWRSVTSPVGFWFSMEVVGAPQVKGFVTMPSEQTPRGSATPTRGTLRHFGTSMQGGIDLVPIGFVSVGPLIGYHFGFNSFAPETDETSSAAASSSGLFIEHGLQYGGHVRARSAGTVGKPSAVYGDASVFQRKGRYVTGTYARLEGGWQPGGGVSLSLFYQTRWQASGAVALADVDNANKAIGAMMPLERMIGVGMGFVWDRVADEGTVKK